MNSTQAAAPGRLIRLPEVLRLTGLSENTVYRIEARGQFPRRRRITRRLVAWKESEVLAWIEGRPYASDR